MNEISSGVPPSKSNIARAEGVGATGVCDELSVADGEETDGATGSGAAASDVLGPEAVVPKLVSSGSSPGMAGGADGVNGSGGAGTGEDSFSVF